MKTYFQYKNQIEGFKDVSATVKVIEKISASSVHFLKQEVASLNFYAAKIEEALSRLTIFYQESDHPLLRKRAGKNILIVLTGEKGLVGGLWHQVINTFLDNSQRYDQVVVVGSKGEEYLAEENVPISKFFAGFQDMPLKEEIEHIVSYIFSEFKKGNISQVDVLYPHFLALSEQQPAFIKFLPFDLAIKNEEAAAAVGLPIFESSKRDNFTYLLQKYIEIFFYKIIMETKLSELSARTVAMEHASDRTDEFVKRFTFDYAKERHRVVTQKQLESFLVHKTL